MDFRHLGCAGWPGRSRRPRPLALPGVLTFLAYAGCVCPQFSAPSGGAGVQGGGEDASSVKAVLPQSKVVHERNHNATSALGAERSNTLTEDNLQSPSSGYSSSIMWAVNSSTNNPAVRVVYERNHNPTSALGAERSNTPTEYNLHSPSLGYSSSRMRVANSSANNPAVTEPEVLSSSENSPAVKGLLSFLNTLADKMLPFSFGVVTLLLGYSVLNGSTKPNNENPLVQSLCVVAFAVACLNVYVAARASYFKESGLIDNIRFEIFIWMLFVVVVAFITECCIILCVFAKVPIWAVCLLGIAGFYFTVDSWVAYTERPKFLIKWKRDIMRNMEFYVRPRSDSTRPMIQTAAAYLEHSESRMQRRPPV